MISEQELYSQALAALKANDLPKARDLFSQILKLNPKNIDYWLWMSAAVATPKERVYCLRQVLVLDPENSEAQHGLRMAGEDIPVSTPDPKIPTDVAWKTSLELADDHPDRARGLRSRLALYSFLGIAIIGIFGFGIYLAVRSNNANQNTTTIKRWTVTVSPTCTETVTPNPSTTGALPSIALEATFTPTPIYVATPHNRLEAYNAGMRAYEKGEWAQALVYFQQVLDVEPNDADVYYHMGDVYRFQGDYASALAAYQNARQIDANFAPAYLGIAQVDLYGSPQKLDDAQTSLQTAVNLDPNLHQAYLELANLSLTQNNVDAALDWLQKATDTGEDTAAIELARAKAYLAKGDGENALTAIQKANQMDRSLVEVYTVWAQVLQANGDFASSIQPLQIAAANAPNDLTNQILLARAYYESGDSDKAMQLVNASLQKDSKSIDAYLLRADLHLDAGDTDAARADFNSVLRLSYNNFDANLGIGRVMLAETLAGSAYNDFDYTEKFAQTDAQKATLLYWRAKALIVLDVQSAAIRDFEDALNYGENLLPYRLKQDALEQLGKLYTATPTATETLTPTPPPGTTVTATPAKSATARPSATPTQK
jgi:tetratricopeptide (TPR) repeat protein